MGTADGRRMAGRALTVAWMSVALGMLMQAVTLAVTWGWPSSLVADLLGRVSWSVFVCVPLVIGGMAAQWRPTVTGVVGLLVAPVASISARAIQKALVAGTAALTATTAPGPLELAAVKGVQYSVFGWLIGRVASQGRGAALHLAVGAGVGLVVAGYVGARATGAGAETAATLASAVNEVLFPVGCSLIVWASGALQPPRD